MLTVKKLKEILSMHNDDARVILETSEDICHTVNLNDGTLVLSRHKPIGICNRTSGYVYPTNVEGYAGYCPELDEDLYQIEFTPLNQVV